MNDWRHVWERLAEGEHVVVQGTGPIPQPDPNELRLLWVDCEAHPEPGGTLEEARRQIDQVLGLNPAFEAASRRLRAGLRRHLLGEGGEDVAVARYEDAFRRRGNPVGPRAALVLFGIDQADRLSLERLARLFAGDHRPTWPLLIHFDARQPTGEGRRLLDQLERVLPPEAFIGEASAPAPVSASASPEDVLSSLSPETLRVLRAAATIGDRFELETLADLLEIDPVAVLEALQQALDRGLSLQDRGRGVFRFDARTSAALRASTLPSLAFAWHERLAALFGGLPAPRRAPHQLSSSAEPIRPNGAADAVSDAIARVGPSTAAETIPPARGDGGSQPISDVPTLPEHLRSDPFWQRMLAETLEARRTCAGDGRDAALTRGEGPARVVDVSPGDPVRSEERAAIHSEAAGLWENACEQHLASAERAVLGGQYERALKSSASALALIDRLADPDRRRAQRARALLAIGHARWRSHGPNVSALQEALESLEEARSLLRDDKPAEQSAAVSSLIANVCYDIGTPAALERAVVELQRAGQVLLHAGRPLDAARLLNDEAAVWVKLGDVVQASQLLSRSRDVFAKVADSYPAARLELLETEHLLARLVLHAPHRPGQEREALRFAIEHALAAEKGYRELGEQRELGRVWETLGRLDLRLGRIDEAARRLEDAQRLQRKSGDVIGLARSSSAMSEVFVAARDYARALDHLTESINSNAQKGAGIGLEFNLMSLRAIEGRLPQVLHERANALARRIVQALAGG